MGWNLEQSYAQLPETLFAEAKPAQFSAPRMIILNEPLAESLGLDLEGVAPDRIAALFAGQDLPPGAKPIAQAYAGHQFGGFTMLGDGRALLLGEQRTPGGELFDIQFKGSGPTSFSRRGDGLAALGPMLREYIISEAMYGLGIPTTRSLAVVATGQPVYRETALDGAVLTRVAASHIRVGTFQYLAAMKNEAGLRALADYTLSRHFPHLESAENSALALLKGVVDQQASLIAKWQLVGFIHGVMNTDNMAICGETIDYGPCAFMDTFDPETVFSSIDHGGRYAYGQQPVVGQWNLARFAETLLPLIDANQEQAIEIVTAALNEYAAIYERYWLQGMRGKLGLSSEQSDDRALISELLDWMQNAKADFTNTFDDLTSGNCAGGHYQDEGFQSWLSKWTARIEADGNTVERARAEMQACNPVVIPRNHRVEEALAAATKENNLNVMHELLNVLRTPFARTATAKPYQTPPPPGQCYKTFCGT